MEHWIQDPIKFDPPPLPPPPPPTHCYPYHHHIIVALTSAYKYTTLVETEVHQYSVLRFLLCYWLYPAGNSCEWSLLLPISCEWSLLLPISCFHHISPALCSYRILIPTHLTISKILVAKHQHWGDSVTARRYIFIAS